MGLSQINDIDLMNEKKSLNKLFECSDSFTSVVFNSGAGSGKTYALIQCLKYIISIHHDDLKNHNQKIGCITYTNVAAEHIKHQLGVSDVVEISTIHERIWSIICSQKSALLGLHIEKLNSEVELLNSQLLINSEYEKYRALDASAQERFFQLMLENKKKYNMAYNLKATEFKAAMPEEIRLQYAELISNVSKFKGLVDKLFKRKRYLDCLCKIESGEKDYRVVNYDAMYNRDRLDKMRISHDTLLEYGYELIERYPRMRQLIIDKYPYILIDEYQDTADIVVKIMSLIEQYAKQIKHDVFIAYFGDSVQNIYDTGVGKRLTRLHPELDFVLKEYNRRSYIEVIDVANRVRNDEVVQKSIYSDCSGGDVKIYYGSGENVSKFIEKCAEKWSVKIENPLHCMFATNQMVAGYSGFPNVYEVFKRAEIYRGIGYKQLNSELLSHDIIHLGRVQAILYRLIKLYTEVREEKQPLRDIFPSDKYRNMSFLDLKLLIASLRAIDGNTLDELLGKIFNEYSMSNHQMYKLVMEKIFDVDEDLSYDKVLTIFVTSLYKSWDETLGTKEIIQDLLDIKLEELLNWFHYIHRDEKKEICYHTFHSTKGLEYENVAIILGKDFGQDKDLFKLYFMNYGENEEQVSDKYEKGRNILYVAITRAIKNLRVLYIDDFEEIKDGIERVFEKAYLFTNDIAIEDF